MIRGTTPTEIYTITNPQVVDLNNCVQIWVTISDYRGHHYTFDISRLTIDASDNAISLTLTQEETLALAVGKATVQIRFLYNDDSVFATKPLTFMVEDVRREGVITDE